MNKYMYDFLNMFSYIGTIFFTLLYNKFLTQVDARRLVFYQLVFFLISNLLVLANALRLNNHYFGSKVTFGGASDSDIVLNTVNFFIATQALQSLSALPV